MQEYSYIESNKVYSYFKLCIDSIKDRLNIDTYNLGVILPHNQTITCIVNCYKKLPRYKGPWWDLVFNKDYAFPERYYCMIDIKRNNILVRDLSDSKILYKGKTGVTTNFSDFVYGKVRKGLLKIPFKL